MLVWRGLLWKVRKAPRIPDSSLEQPSGSRCAEQCARMYGIPWPSENVVYYGLTCGLVPHFKCEGLQATVLVCNGCRSADVPSPIRSARSKHTPRGVELGDIERSHHQNGAEGGGQLSPRRREQLEEALELAELEAILSKVPSMTGLSQEELSVLARSLEWIAVPNGEYVYRQNQPGDDFYIVMCGGVQKIVESSDPAKPGIPISQPLGPSSFFGEKVRAAPLCVRCCGFPCGTACSIPVAKEGS